MPVRNMSRWKGNKYAFSSIDEFISEKVPSGYLTIDHNGIPIDLSYEPFIGSDVTIVMLHAAVSSRVASIPIFTGQSVTKGVRANIVRVSDPSLFMDAGLELAWYAGNATQELQKDLLRVLLHVFESTGSSKVVFFGSSGGGYASAFFGAHFEGSLAIAVNPQTIISSYTPGPVDQFLKVCFGVVPADHTERVEALHSLIISDLRQVYSGKISNDLAIVQNARDRHHYEKHLLPFLDKMSSSPRISLKVSDWGVGHKPPSPEYISMLLHSAASADDWNAWLEQHDFSIAATPEVAQRLRAVCTTPPS